MRRTVGDEMSRLEQGLPPSAYHSLAKLASCLVVAAQALDRPDRRRWHRGPIVSQQSRRPWTALPTMGFEAV